MCTNSQYSSKQYNTANCPGLRPFTAGSCVYVCVCLCNRIQTSEPAAWLMAVHSTPASGSTLYLQHLLSVILCIDYLLRPVSNKALSSAPIHSSLRAPASFCEFSKLSCKSTKQVMGSATGNALSAPLMNPFCCLLRILCRRTWCSGMKHMMISSLNVLLKPRIQMQLDQV